MINPNEITAKFLEYKEGPADHRERIQSLDVTKSFLVSAPAGSGKTELLTQRYLALLSVVSEPEQIHAITFTNKAAFEMRARIVSILTNALTAHEPSKTHEQLSWELGKAALKNSEKQGWDILNNVARLKVRTIDAFYGAIVRRSPMSALMGGGLSITEDANSCYTTAAREILSELENNTDYNDSLEAILLHVDNRFDRAEQLLISLLEKREHWLPIVMSARNTDDLRDKLESGLLDIVNEITDQTNKELCLYQNDLFELIQFSAKFIDYDKYPNLKPLLSIIEQESGGFLSNISPGTYRAVCDYLLTKDGKLRKSATATLGFPALSKAKSNDEKELFKTKKAAFKQLLEAIKENQSAVSALHRLNYLPPTAYLENEWGILKHLLSLLPNIAAKLLTVFQREGAIDHAEMATSALRVMGDTDAPTDLTLLLDSQIDHILIDEFQDTNYLQLKGLKLLTAGWEPDDGRSLFLVGDPMQSIYGFRGSNVGLFLNLAEKGIGSINLNTLNLTVNFRSNANIVNWVNETFASVFPNKQNANLGAIQYTSSVPFHESSNSSEINLQTFVGENTRPAEGRWIAERVRSIRNSNSEESVAILVRNRAHLKEVVNHLQELNLPYQAIDIDPLRTQPVIRDLMALTRALCHFGDRTAWLALLRSQVLGLTLAELELVSTQSKTRLIFQNLQDKEILNLLTPESRIKLKKLIRVINSSQQNIFRKPISHLVEGAWVELYGPACVKTNSDMANADVFLKSLEQFEYALPSPHQLERCVDKLFAKPSNYVNNPVQIMTMHKSKGLQFDHVFIPGCNRTSKADDKQLLAWDRYTCIDGFETPLITASPEAGQNSNELYQFITSQESERKSYEKERILYVGCTRAIKTLSLTWCSKFDSKGDAAPPSKNSFAGSIYSSIFSQVTSHISDDHESNCRHPVPAVSAQAVRLETNNEAIELPSNDLLKLYRGRLNVDNSELPSLRWGVDYNRQRGILIHRILNKIHSVGIEAWKLNNFDSLTSSWRTQLMQEGVPRYIAPAIVKDIHTEITNILSDSTALWILERKSIQDRTEYKLSCQTSGIPTDYIIDRCFIEDDIQWLIDYKTSEPNQDESEQQFVQRIVSDSRTQLSKYAALLSGLNELPVRSAVYITRLQKFVEIENQQLDIAI